VRVLRPVEVSCDGKIGYETRQAAKQQLRKLRAAGVDIRRMSAYRCVHYCGLYHLGHHPPGGWDTVGSNGMASPIDGRDLPGAPAHPTVLRMNGPVALTYVPRKAKDRH
jgi:hypothetical protein